MGIAIFGSFHYTDEGGQLWTIAEPGDTSLLELYATTFPACYAL
jgi:hypothetical protein